MKFKSILSLCCLFVLAAPAALAANLDYLLVDHQSYWEYAIKDVQIGVYGDASEQATRDLEYNNSYFSWDDVVWQTGQAGFGNGSHSTPGYPHSVTRWLYKTTLLVQKSFSYSALTADLGQNFEVTGLTLVGAADNAMALFINGHKMQGYYGNGIAYGDFSFNYSISAAELAGVWNQGGDNIFQFVVTDTGGDTFFDVQITAQLNLTGAVPVPAAVWLMGTGLAGLAALRRRAGARP